MSIWKTLLETAIHAPSPHNVQPWRVRILSDDRADLLIEKRRTLPKEDPTGSFIILTMGLFIEALRILAGNRSLKLEYELYQAPSQFTPEHIARAEGELLLFARLSLTRRQVQTAGAGEKDRREEQEPGAGEKGTLSEVAGEAPAVPSKSLRDAYYDDSLFLTRRTSRISLLPRPVPDEATQALGIWRAIGDISTSRLALLRPSNGSWSRILTPCLRI